MLKKVNKKVKKNISGRTTRRIIQKGGGSWKRQGEDINLTVGQKRKRLDWSVSKKDVSTEMWCMHDESYYGLNNPNKKRRVFPDSPKLAKKKGGRKLKFEGFITPNHKSDLYFWTGTRNSSHFVNHFFKYYDDRGDKFFRNKIYGDTKFFLDQAPGHWAKDTRKTLNDRNIDFEYFCAKPCELNLIEQFWRKIKKKWMIKIQQL